MNDLFELTEMTPEHIPAAAELERRCFSLPWSAQSLLSELEDPLSHCVAAVGDGGSLLGYAFMQSVLDEGYIGNLAVSPDARRLGIGSALLRSLLDFGRESGLAFLTLEVRAGNAPAIALYRKQGFTEAGRRKKYYFAPVEDALIMTYYYNNKEV